jgi:uncharacterized protein with NAD-binding domain and iron-sulfur cluster
MPSADSRPTKVAIVGGGCAALAAAFELTRPELEGRFEVTVYQMGWRLGGKGASGRGACGRIEEHGLHLWMGYYENAFRLMRECYEELHRRPTGYRELTFEEAFSPAGYNGAMDWSPSGRWLPWKVDLPAWPGLPGDPDPPRLGIAQYLVHATRLLRTLLSTLPIEREERDADAGKTLSGAEPRTAEEMKASLARLSSFGMLAGLGTVVEVARWLELVLGELPSFPQSLAGTLLDFIGQSARARLEQLTEVNDETRRLWEVADLLLATMRGAIRFRLAFDPRGFDAIDDYDCREWLRLNGASERSIDSAFIRALYDLAFAYAGGDPRRPAIAAGSALRGALRAFFTYRGAFFWKMNTGMGDAVFAPLYQVLRRRGVRFEFFHKLTHVELGDDGTRHVAALELDVQARTRSGGAYEPLRDVNGFACWPSSPSFEQLEGGDRLRDAGVDLESQWDRRLAERKTLRVGADFDLVVLGVGLGVVGSVCTALVESDERWRNMIAFVKSVPTQAFQIWLDRGSHELGWKGAAINVSGFVEPFDTWADMTHLAPMEMWPRPPRSIAYFCNVLPELGEPDGTVEGSLTFVASARERVRGECIRFLNEDVRHLWPNAVGKEGGFLWDALVVANETGERGPARFTSQYFTANVRPSDRYSQALPGSTKYRISPLDRTYDNLTVAGDWTSSGLNMGCVEAAVMSGRLAAHALSGTPQLKDIVGYDHP